MLRVGLIGLGAMGLPMGRNVLKAGFPLAVWARRPESAEAIVAEGAEWVSSAASLAAEVDVLLLVVTNSPDVEELVLGAGVLQGARPGTVIVDHSTIAPDVSRRLAEECAQREVAFLDAPVSGGTMGAEAGTLTVMVGGEGEALERVRPVLEAVGGTIFHVGPSGSGEVVKLVNNMLVGAIAAATAEALVLGARGGIPVEIMAQVVGASTGASWQLANQFPRCAFNGSFQPGFMTDLLVKDLDLALAYGAEMQVPHGITGGIRALYARAQEAGYGRDDYTSVLRVLESEAGVVVREEQGGN
jgi:3-hydroxyisobutyrate dehydrogenase